MPFQQSGFILQRASEVKEAPVVWLWNGWIPLGAISILDGDPGTGKSTLTAALIAAVTAGRPLPGGEPVNPGSAVMLTHEDSVAATIVPRLRIAGADLGKITLLRAVMDAKGQWRLPTLPEDTARLGLYLQARPEVRLVVIDPILSYLSEKYDAHRDHHARRILPPLADVAQRCKVAMLFLRHLNKVSSLNPLYRGSGSIGFAGQARSVLGLFPDPTEKDFRHLAHLKSNLGQKQRALSFRLAREGDHARVQWEGFSRYSGFQG